MNIYYFYTYIIILSISSVVILLLYIFRKLRTCVYASIPIALINESIFDTILYTPILDQVLLLVNMFCLSSVFIHILKKKYAIVALLFLLLIQLCVAIAIIFWNCPADILLLPSLLLVWVLGSAKFGNVGSAQHWQIQLATNYSFSIAAIHSLHYCVCLLYQDFPYSDYITNSLLIFYSCMLLCVLFILSIIIIKKEKKHV